MCLSVCVKEREREGEGERGYTWIHIPSAAPYSEPVIERAGQTAQ